MGPNIYPNGFLGCPSRFGPQRSSGPLRALAPGPGNPPLTLRGPSRGPPLTHCNVRAVGIVATHQGPTQGQWNFNCKELERGCISQLAAKTKTNKPWSIFWKLGVMAPKAPLAHVQTQIYGGCPSMWKNTNLSHKTPVYATLRHPRVNDGTLARL